MISAIYQFSLLGFLAFQRRHPSLHEVAVISILDRGEGAKFGLPDLQSHHSFLRLSFEDTYEEPGEPDWPDEPSSLQHLRYSQSYGERVPTLEDAFRVVGFVNELRHRPESVTLAVHCHGGISRSVAVAQSISARLFLPVSPAPAGVPMPFSAPRPNPRMVRLLEKAWAHFEQRASEAHAFT